jgi:hypothetical protein
VRAGLRSLAFQVLQARMKYDQPLIRRAAVLALGLQHCEAALQCDDGGRSVLPAAGPQLPAALLSTTPSPHLCVADKTCWAL